MRLRANLRLEERQEGGRSDCFKPDLQCAEGRLQVLSQDIDFEDAVLIERLEDTIDIAARHEALVSSQQRRLDSFTQGHCPSC